MSILLNLQNWLTLDETDRYIKLKTQDQSGRASLKDLIPIIEERTLSCYWCNQKPFFYSSNRWITIRKSNSIIFDKPENHLTQEQIDDDYLGERIEGHLSLDLDEMMLSAATIYHAWNQENHMLDSTTFPLVCHSKEDEKTLIAKIDIKYPPQSISQADWEAQLKSNTTPKQEDNEFIREFSQLDIVDLVEGIRFKKSDIDSIITEAKGEIKTTAEKQQDNPEQQLPTKTKNDYLRTIRALSSSLIGGLTERHYSDAQAIASILKENCPVSEKQLAKYLKEASETPPKGK